MCDIVFVGDETDDEDLEVVFAHLRLLGASAVRKHPASFTFIGQSGSIAVLCEGRPFEASLVVGWVFETWLAPGAQILEGLSLAGYRVLNTGATLARGQNKFLMSLRLAAAGVPHGQTMCTFDARGLDAYFQSGASEKLVLKPGFVNCGGLSVITSGQGVCKVERSEEAYAQLTTLQTFGQPIYAQKYVDRVRNSDIRVWLFGNGQYDAVRKVPSAGHWVTNTSFGVTLETYTVSPECLRICRAASEAIGAQIAGIDIAESDSDFVVLEVNTCPTFLPSISLIGQSVPEKWAQFLSSVASDEAWALT